MYSQSYLDKIISEYGVSRYEDIIMSGFDMFAHRCSEEILKRQDFLSNSDLHNLLYLLKYLHQSWLDSTKNSRKNKEICLKVLFVVLISGKHIFEWKQLLEKSVNRIHQNWEISPNDYPFLTHEETDRILSFIKCKARSGNLDTEHEYITSDRTDKNHIFYFIPDRIYDDLMAIDKTVRHFPESCKNKGDLEYVKAILNTINEPDITKEFPAILKILPLQVFLTTLHKILTPRQECKSIDFVSCDSAESNMTLLYEKKLFLKEQQSEDYQPVPEWAEWFFQAGQEVSLSVGTSSDNLIIGFSLPTRCYAALFFLLGYETWRSGYEIQTQIENKIYFDKLAACDQDEALLILENNHWKRCWFKGTEIIGGEKCIKVEVPGAKKKQYIDYVLKSNIAKLRKAVDPGREIAANQIGFKMSGMDSLVSYYNKKENEVLKFLIQEKMSCLLFGNASAIKQEIDQANFYVKSNNEYKKISFQHILRFENFMTEFDLPRHAILNSQESINSHSKSSDMVLYDGSLPFLNHQGIISGQIEIIFLDRTDPQFSNACGELMTRYIDREEDLNILDKIPASVELVAFKE